MIARILKEPLVHFLLIGGLIFATFSVQDDTPPAPDRDQIVITQADLATLSAQFEAAWKRQPQPDELNAMTQELIREKVLVRAALELGMDQNDAVINRRLSQKMEFFAASIAEAIEPQDGELEAFYQTNATDYQIAPQFALNQIYLGQKSTPETVATTLSALKEGEDPTELGQPTLLPARLDLTQSRALDSAFGTGFAAALSPLSMDEWVGPVKSGYGVHLVQITDKSPSTLPPLDQVADRVLSDWQSAKREEVQEQYYQTLRRGYEVTLPQTDGGS
ncbi:hypothetical protein DL239_04805 [Sedimentitalea sp. CY04]|uniref:Parvulin-like PPIase n=1 Tax=Parasedimentitalea denitrificans TaxID=2211118 RepID=A0ABX0W660_9RHOB|nr:peptidylprolyl isomerase [Sedimentitalea sp. CY04]NIZ60289.1 hypothetical protein [Sedimentitalea sp. CY04]